MNTTRIFEQRTLSTISLYRHFKSLEYVNCVFNNKSTVMSEDSFSLVLCLSLSFVSSFFFFLSFSLLYSITRRNDLIKNKTAQLIVVVSVVDVVVFVYHFIQEISSHSCIKRSRGKRRFTFCRRHYYVYECLAYM